MNGFTIGLSALDAAQQGLDIVGQNLANADTPGYHRQVVDLAASPGVQIDNVMIGTGVQVTGVQQITSQLLDSAVTANGSDVGDTTAQLNTLNQVQADLGQGTSSLDDDLTQFFNQITQLASEPEDPTLRQVVVSGADTLTEKFNSVAGEFSSLSAGLDTQAGDLVNQINSDAQQIAQLNGEIQDASARGVNANDQIDERGQLINDLAQNIGVQVTPGNAGQVTVVAAGTALVLGNQAATLQYNANPQGQATVTTPGSTTPLPVSGGQLAGLLTVRNQTLPNYQAQLNNLAGTLAQQVDGIQATGIGLSGPSTFLAGTRPVNNVTVPLAQAGLAFPPQAGSLFVTVTDLATGAQTLTQLNIDPTTQSLQDVANALSGVANIQAVTNPQTGTLQILAKPGYAFDFAGRVPTNPDTSGITGSTQPQLGGTYTGSANDVYTFQVVGSGTVGVTPGLSLDVTNSADGSVATLNIGQGYQPGSSLGVANGLTVQLSNGTANNGDTFSTPVVAQPDTAGLLTALGLGTFFTGSTAADLAVQPALQNDPSLVAASRNGQPGDSSNLTRLAALNNAPVMAGGTQTFLQSYASLVGDVGTQVQDLGNLQTSQQALATQLQTQQQSISGVDPNEELVNMLDFQRSFEMASEYISTLNTTLNSLFQMLVV